MTRWFFRISWLLPVMVALARTRPTPQWDADAALLRDYALAPSGFGGGVSTALANVVAAIPLGTIGFRLTLVSALALGVALFFLGGMIERLLGALFDRPALARSRAAVAALFTLLVGLAAPMQIEATRPGGALVATALALGAVYAVLDFLTARERLVAPTLLIVGPLLGLALAEQPATGVVATFAVILGLVVGTRLDGRLRAVPRRAIGLGAGLLVAVALVFSLPPIVRWLLARDGLTVAVPPVPFARAVGIEAAKSATSVLAELGFVAVGLAAGGLVIVLASRRRALVSTSALALAGCFVLSHALPAFASARALGMTAVAALAAVAAFALVDRARRLPFGGAATTIAFAAQAAIVALVSEDAATKADRGELMGAAVFTDAFLADLPADAALLVHDTSVARRLIAAQVHEGARPDALVLVAPWLGDREVATRVLATEPEAETLVRTMMLTSRADEFALSRLADQRALFLEPRAGFSRQVEDYLLVDGYWLFFSPHPVGAVDRRAAIDTSLPRLRAFAETMRSDPADDPTSSRIVSGALGGITNVLVDLQDTEGASALFALGRTLPPSGAPFGVSVESRFVDAATRLLSTRAPKKVRARAGDRARRAR